MKLIPPTGLARAIALVLLLSGCQTPPASQVSCAPTVLPPATQKQVQAVQTHTSLLAQSGAINQKALTFPPPLTANSQRVTVAWDGDAIELLATLARQRGLEFAYSGTRLPLPVDVNVKEMTFENLLTLLKVQIGWRAKLVQDGVELRLYFTVPDKGGRLA